MKYVLGPGDWSTLSSKLEYKFASLIYQIEPNERHDNAPVKFIENNFVK